MLSCECGYDDFEWYYYPPDDFIKFELNRRKRCVSCGNLIDIGSDCLRFERYRNPRSYIEENIYGDEVPIADEHMCEKCGEIFLNLTTIGYCITLGGNIKEDLEDYWDITGFKPKKE